MHEDEHADEADSPKASTAMQTNMHTMSMDTITTMIMRTSRAAADRPAEGDVDPGAVQQPARPDGAGRGDQQGQRSGRPGGAAGARNRDA